MESLEPRVLLTVIPVTDTGNIVTNGTNLQNAINSAVYGDIIVLDANASYLSGLGGFLLPYKAGTGTITIESSDIYEGAGHLPSGVRVGASVAKYMPKLLTPGSNASVIKTEINASGNPSHDYALLGVEMAPLSPLDSFTNPFVQLGVGDATQNTEAKVAYDFVVDRCYIHGLDPVSANVYASYKSGIALNGSYLTISNCEVSNIHTQTPDCQAISGRNGIGHFTITNNFLEGSSECFLLGGAKAYIPNLVPHDITFTNNHLAKRASWNPYDPSFYDPENGNFGIKWNIKNLFELKCAEDVLVDGNLMEGSWVLGDQVAPAVLFTPRNQTSDGSNPWNTVGHVTFTNNVIRSVGEGIQIATCPNSDGWYPQATHDITIRNNVFENIDCHTDGPGYGIIATRGKDPMWGLVIDHNTFYNSQAFMYMGAPDEESFITSGFEFTNNICQYGDAGLSSTNGSGTTALNIYTTGIAITNHGSGYTSAPAVSFTGGGGTGAAATATYDAATGTFTGIIMTSRGSGYTSVPTIVITGGGGTGGAAAFDPAAIVNGELGAWKFTNNLMLGPNPSTAYPSGNYSATCVDNGFIRDPAGELQGLLDTSIGHNAATAGSYFADIGADPSTLAPDFIPLDSTLTGYWKFDEGSGTSASDSIPVGTHSGTLSGSPLPAWTTSGQSHDAVSLGGTGGYVSVPSFTTSATFSFAAWIKPGTITADSYIASAGNSAFSLYVNSAGKLVAKGTNSTTVTDAVALAANQWYFVGVTYSGGTLTLYKNGVSVGSAASSSTTAGSTTLYIGDNGGTASSFTGSIDEARYYNSDMSAKTFTGITSMQQLYANFGPLVGAINPSGYSPITGTTATLSAYSVATHSAPTYRGAPAVISFTWSVYSGPSGVTFGADNGTTDAQSCVATFSHAGVYVMQVDLTDSVGGRSTDIGHFVTVKQVPTSVSITPAAASVATGGTRQFTNVNSGIDQFGDPLTGTWSWAVASGGAGGTITSTGLYNAPASAGADIIQLKYNNTVVTTTSTDADVTVTGATLPSVTIAATDSSAAEKWDPTGTYTVTRTGSTSAALTVNYAISGTATNGTDYSTLGTTVTIPAGSASKTITISPIDDTSIEGTETAILTLVSGTGYAIGSANSAKVNITDADDKPTVTIAATDASASEGGSNVGVFTLTRSGTGPGLTAGPLAVIVNITGTASNTDDYETLPQTAVFMPGETTTTVTVIPKDDALVEDSETVILTVATCGNSTYTVGSPSSATVTITDNDVSSTYEDFNYTVGGGSNWQGQNGGTGWNGSWSLTGTATSGIYSGSLDDPTGTLATSGNSAWLWNSVRATRTTTYTFGQDGTSLWVGWLMRQHADGASPLLRSSLWVGADSLNHIELGSPWHDFYDGQAYSSGSRYYMPSSGVAPVDNQTVFLVYRIDFNSTTADQVRLWINPTPGTAPSDASANSTWTLGTGLHFNFVDSDIKLVASNYYNRVTFDEVRLGLDYNSVAPAEGGGGLAPQAQPVKLHGRHAQVLPAGNSEAGRANGPARNNAVLAGPVAVAATAPLKRSMPRVFRAAQQAAGSDSPFDILSVSPLAGVNL